MLRLVSCLLLLCALAPAQIVGQHRKVFTAAAPATCGAVGNACTDSFRTSASIGSQWTQICNGQPSYFIGGSGPSSYNLSNRSQTNPTTCSAILQYTGGSFTDNQVSQMTVTTVTAGVNLTAGPGIRITDGTHYAYCRVTQNGNLFGIYQNTGSGEGSIGGSQAYTAANGDIITASVSSTTMTCTVTRSGSTLVTATGTISVTGGSPGMVNKNDWQSGAWAWNDFSGVSQ